MLLSNGRRHRRRGRTARRRRRPDGASTRGPGSRSPAADRRPTWNGWRHRGSNADLPSVGRRCVGISRSRYARLVGNRPARWRTATSTKPRGHVARQRSAANAGKPVWPVGFPAAGKRRWVARSSAGSVPLVEDPGRQERRAPRHSRRAREGSLLTAKRQALLARRSARRPCVARGQPEGTVDGLQPRHLLDAVGGLHEVRPPAMG